MAYPLMLTALSNSLMVFFDRLFLGRYDLDAMNAAAAIGAVCAAVGFGGLGLTHIAGVFVGQYNGAQKRNQMAWPVWQMIWFSLMAGVVVLPLALFGENWVVAEAFRDAGTGYYRWLMGSVFLVPMTGALASFFIGQGQVRVVTVAAIVGNVLNVMLDPLFIWGWRGVFPEMGAQGAAISTVIGELAQVGVLWALFLSPKNQKTTGSLEFKFRPRLFWECLRLGVPQAMSHFLEVFAWALFLAFLSRFKKEYITVHTIGLSIFLLCSFMAEGLYRAATAIVSNLIGAKREDQIPRFLRSGVTLTMLIGLIVAVPLFVFPELVTELFIGPEHAGSQIHHYSTLALRGVGLFFVFDVLSWMIAGILAGGGDTRTVLLINTLSVWVFGFLPCVLWLLYRPSTPATAWLFFIPVYAFSNLCLMLWRYTSHKWLRLRL